MIKKILTLKNVGLLQDATVGGAVTLGKVTAIYADNGRGKSTLAAMFRSCQIGDGARLAARTTIDGAAPPYIDLLLSAGKHTVFDNNVWSQPIPDIIVFDAEFVELNVCSGFEVRADQRQALLDFALGETAVQLKRNVEQLTEDIEVQTSRRKLAERELVGHGNPYSVAEFVNVLPIGDATTKIATLRKRIDAGANAQTLKDRPQPVDLPQLRLDVTDMFNVFDRELVSIERSALESVLSHLIKHNGDGIEPWISAGQEFLTGNQCPFCDQSVDGIELIEAYKSYFSIEYSQLMASLETLDTHITSKLSPTEVNSWSGIITTNIERIGVWRDYLDLRAPTLDGRLLRERLDWIRTEVDALVLAKRQHPLTRTGGAHERTQLVAAIDDFNSEVAQYNATLAPACQAINVFLSSLSSSNTARDVEDIKKLEAAQKRAEPQVVELVAEYLDADAERKRLDGAKKTARQQVDTLMQSTLQQFQNRINELLLSFGAEFSVEQLKPTYVGGEPRTEYALAIRGKAVKLGGRMDRTISASFGSTLSEADKRTLAYAFFMARLDADDELAQRIIVLDDPVCSLDRNRRYQSLRSVCSLAERCGQLIVLSHEPTFLRDMRLCLGPGSNANVDLAFVAINRSATGYSAFGQCDIDDICSSDYFRHHRIVADFVDGKSAAAPRDVAKAIRPMLEGYYHRRFPRQIPSRLMFGQLIAMADDTNMVGPLTNLRPLSGELRAINEFVSQFHHDTNAGFESVPVVDAELLTFAKRALLLIYVSG